MKLNLIYFDNEILISKECWPQEIWREKLFYFKSSLTFENLEDLISFLKSEYKLDELATSKIINALSDTIYNFFMLKLDTGFYNQIEVKKTSLNFLGNKGTMVYWEDWCWVLTKVSDDYYLWVYIGGIAEMSREMILSAGQKSQFLINGKPFIKTLAEQLGTLNSTIYSEAIKENRKTL